jgi:hypothetical protein
MNTSTTTELMHTVLDGEATPDEVRELDLRLASDAAARTEFSQLRSLFDDLGRVPPRLPPEDLQARLLSQANQPLAAPRVIGSSTLRDSFSKFISTLRHTFMADPDRNGADMKKMWMGGAVAVVAVIGVAQFGLGGKPADKDVTGTIVPADRYRADQPTAGDVKVGAPTGAGTGTDERPPVKVDGQANGGAQADKGSTKANDGAQADKGSAKANDGAQADKGSAKANAGAQADNISAKANGSAHKANAGAQADSSSLKANAGAQADNVSAKANGSAHKANAGAQADSSSLKANASAQAQGGAQASQSATK